ncbi:MAG: MFS transporter [Candidatus Omnitrophica bacterium]|nr:MFS transporter [Candidatus Omnitrophota bacterium]
MFFKSHFPHHIRKNYNYDFWAGILFGIYAGLILPFIFLVARRLGASPFQLALIASAPFYGNLISFYWAHKAQSGSKKSFVVCGSIISRSLLLFTLLINAPFPFSLVVFFSQFLSPMIDPAYVGVMSEVYPDSYRGKAMGYVRIGASLAIIASCFFGGKFLDLFGHRLIFPLGAMFGILSSLVFAGMDVSEKEPISVSKFEAKEILRIMRKDSDFSTFEIFYFIFGFGNLLFVPVFPIFLVDTLGISNFDAGKLSVVASIFGLIAVYFWGHIIDKKGARFSIPFAVAGLGFVPFLYFFAKDMHLLYAASIISGICFAGLDLLILNSMIEFSNKTLAPKYHAIHTTFMGIRGVVAPFLGIRLMHILGARMVFMLSFLSIIVSSILLIGFNIKNVNKIKMINQRVSDVA